MNRTLTKWTCSFSAILIISFPILFAMDVYSSIDQENLSIKFQGDTGTLLDMYSSCVSCLGAYWVNVCFAIFLAAVWNTKEVIKIGAF